MDEASFIRYLSAKKTVDDRALNRRVWEAMTAHTRDSPPRVLELGGGIGTMIERAAADPALKPRSWTLIDSLPSLVAEAGRRVTGRVPFPVELLAADVRDFKKRGFDPFDLVIANAFLDLFDPALLLPELKPLARPTGCFLFSITFDGLTAWEPEIDTELDRRIVELYHRTMDERVTDGVPSGDSRCGRHLLTFLPRAGFRVAEAGASDWVVYPHDTVYPGDERWFLSCMLGFFEEALSGRPDLQPADLAHWLSARRTQLAAGELTLVVHQLDVLAEVY